MCIIVVFYRLPHTLFQKQYSNNLSPEENLKIIRIILWNRCPANLLENQ